MRADEAYQQELEQRREREALEAEAWERSRQAQAELNQINEELKNEFTEDTAAA